jgi:hypothetical protein
MTIPPRLRKAALIVHIAASAGWIGGVASFLALAVSGVISDDAMTVQGAYVAGVITKAVLLPLAAAALATGILQSVTTTWGLFQHYWVVAKLLFTVIATAGLLLHSQPIAHLAQVAADGKAGAAEFEPLRIQLLVNSGAGLAVLLVVLLLAVVKPRGITRYGWRKRQVAQARRSAKYRLDGRTASSTITDA